MRIVKYIGTLDLINKKIKEDSTTPELQPSLKTRVISIEKTKNSNIYIVFVELQD